MKNIKKTFINFKSSLNIVRFLIKSIIKNIFKIIKIKIEKDLYNKIMILIFVVKQQIKKLEQLDIIIMHINFI